MSDEKRNKKRILLFVFPIALLIALFILPENLQKENFFQKDWYVPLNEIKPFVPDEQKVNAEVLIPFVTASRIGYIDKAGTLLMNLERMNGSIISINEWAVWNSVNDEKIIKKLDGTAIKISANEVPFFHGNRIFSASADALVLTEYSKEGKVLWSYMLPCHVSAFSANDSLVACGLVNGDIVILDNKGNEISYTKIGGSRIEVILGLAVSISGYYVAAITGIDQQRLIILERGQKNYRIIKHKYLTSSFRSQVHIYITSDESYVFYKDMSGIGVFGIKQNENKLLPIPADTFAVYEGSGSLGVCLVADFMHERTVYIMNKPNVIVGKIKLPDKNTFFALKDSTLLFDDGSGIAAIFFKKDM